MIFRTFSLLILFVSVSTHAADQLRVAFGSCADDDKPDHPIWEAVLASDPDAFLMIGDNVYADSPAFQANPSAVLMRAEYAKLAASRGYQRIRAHCPVYATWDDHDFGINDGGADWPFRETAAEIFFEFFDPDSPARHTPGVYTSHMLGSGSRRVQIILLDTRYFRSMPVVAQQTAACPVKNFAPNTDPQATVLGEAQWRWLEEELAKPADARLIVTSIQAIPDEHCWEKWQNFPIERKRLLSLVGRAGVAPVVLLSGDRHLGDISRLPENAAGNEVALIEITASPLSSSSGFGAGEPNRYRVSDDNVRVSHFGLVELSWESPTAEKPTITFKLIDARGEVRASFEN